MDESSIGYNAYSVLKTGGDEYGEFPLISQRGYDDWRRSTYLFLTIPFIGLLGLNVVAVRLPAVILSVLTIWATYHIVLLLFSKRSAFSSGVAFLTSFLLAISPWHIYISRLGHESNACLSFLLFGILFFLQGEKNKSWRRILISMIFLTFSMVSYYSGQAFIPLFVAGLFFIFRKNLLSMVAADRKILVPFFALAVFIVPVFWAIFSPQALVRFQGTSTFKPEVHSKMFGQRVILWNKAVENKDIIGMIVYHRHLFPLVVFAEGYFSHFNPKWLFTNSFSEPFKAPHTGLLNLWEAPFIIMGIFVLVFSKFADQKNKKLVFLWFLLAPIPAAIATQAPHAMRFYNSLPLWQMFTAFGLSYIFYRFRNLKFFMSIIFIFMAISGLLFFCRDYFVNFPKEQSSSFHYTLSKTIPYVLSIEDSYDKIIFSNQENLYQSYMLLLFHSKYNPLLYQQQGGTISGGFAQTHKFGKYEFRPVVWDKDKLLTNTLFVGNDYEFPKQLTGKLFTNLDGRGAIRIVQR